PGECTDVSLLAGVSDAPLPLRLAESLSAPANSKTIALAHSPDIASCDTATRDSDSPAGTPVSVERADLLSGNVASSERNPASERIGIAPPSSWPAVLFDGLFVSAGGCVFPPTTRSGGRITQPYIP